MDSRDLEYVAAVAKTKSFSQAAQLLFISQPALSQYIKRLEKSLNVALFYRTRTHVELTPAGQYYIQQGQEILKQMQGLEQAMRHWCNDEKKQLSIGVSQFYGKWFLTPFLQSIRKCLPAYHIQIVDGESHFLESQMLQGKLDFGIFPAPVTHKEVSFVSLGEEEILFAFSEENKEALDLLPTALKDGKIDLLAYQHFPFVLPKEGLKMHKAALKICRHFGFMPQSVYSSENLDTVYSLVNHNYGVGFLPGVLAQNYNPKTNHVRFFSFRSRYNHRSIGLVYEENSPLRSLVPLLVEAIQGRPEQTGQKADKALPQT